MASLVRVSVDYGVVSIPDPPPGLGMRPDPPPSLGTRPDPPTQSGNGTVSSV